jgi:hypothetical protein
MIGAQEMNDVSGIEKEKAPTPTSLQAIWQKFHIHTNILLEDETTKTKTPKYPQRDDDL